MYLNSLLLFGLMVCIKVWLGCFLFVLEEDDCEMDRFFIDVNSGCSFFWFIVLVLFEFIDEGWDFGFLSFFRDCMLDELLEKVKMSGCIILFLLFFLLGVFCLFDLF